MIDSNLANAPEEIVEKALQSTWNELKDIIKIYETKKGNIIDGYGVNNFSIELRFRNTDDDTDKGILYSETIDKENDKGSEK